MGPAKDVADAASRLSGVDLGAAASPTSAAQHDAAAPKAPVMAAPVAAAAAAERELAAGLRVEVQGLVGAKQHNGAHATVGAFSAESGRYTILLDSGVTIAVKAGNLVVLSAEEDGAAGLAAEAAALAAAAAAGKAASASVAAPRKKSNKVIGIDLGTTNSCVAVWTTEEAGVEVCVNSASGSKTTPSFVAFDGDRRLIGEEAKALQTRNIRGTVYDVKRIIGQRMSVKGVRADVEHLQYKVVEGANELPVVCVEWQGKERRFAPEEISAMVLGRMKQVAEEFLGEEVTRAVITVPAYFSDSQRASTVAAGRIAGLKVERIINEPTAAALAYGLDRIEAPTANVLIFDLGGGTFDVSLLKLEEGIFEVLATGGDVRLGGEDFDLALMRLVLGKVEKQTGNKGLAKDERAVKRVKVAAEKAKIALSSASKTVMQLPGLGGEGTEDLEVELTRAEFEALIKPWVDQSLETVRKVLADAKCDKKDVHEIVLVGGSTRIPVVQSRLREMFDGKELCKSVNPDECVAYGAAVQGAILSGERSARVQALLLVDVTPLSLGVEVEGKAMSTIIKRNTNIPCKKSATYTTCDDWQTDIHINIYEGERSHVEGNNKLGDFEISGIQRAKRGEAKVEVSFELNASGILLVTARDQVTGATANVTVVSGGTRLDEQTVARMVSEAEKFKADDEAFVKKLDSKNELERVVYDITAMVQNAQAAVPEGKELPKRLRDLQAAVDEQAEWLEQVAMTATVEQYDAAWYKLAAAAKRHAGVTLTKMDKEQGAM